MSLIDITTDIAAPIDVVFDVARDLDVHQHSQAGQREIAVAGRMSGLIELGEEVTWEATHFAIRQRLTSRITAMDRPNHFRDSMVRGAFKRFDHDHVFTLVSPDQTVMRDRFDYHAPLGFLGTVAEVLLLSRYMRKLLTQRGLVIRDVAEQRHREAMKQQPLGR